MHKDATSGTLYYVESDGRHVSAIDKEGKLIWCADLRAIAADNTRSSFLGRPTRIHAEAGSAYVYVFYGTRDCAMLDAATGKPEDIIHD